LFYILGAAHNGCNLQTRINATTCEIPVFMHNLKNFDGHILLKHCKKYRGEIKVLPHNLEKLISFKIGDVTFKDSYSFLSASLSSLAELLPMEKFHNIYSWLEYDILANDKPSKNPSINEVKESVDMDFNLDDDFENIISKHYIQENSQTIDASIDLDDSLDEFIQEMPPSQREMVRIYLICSEIFKMDNKA